MTDPSPLSGGDAPHARPDRGRASVLIPALLAAVLAVLGVIALVVGLTGQISPPQPAVVATGAATPPASPPAPPAADLAAPPVTADPPPVVAVAAPVQLTIPVLSVSSDLIELGLHDDGTVEVPPLDDVGQAGWYDGSPRPGANGPSVLLGHVDSAEEGRGVFFSLGALKPGDEIEVGRADGTVARFAVDRVEMYPKADFPTAQVYGDTPGPELRLITCGGAFDSSALSYQDNIVVYAHLTGTYPG